VDQYPVTMLKQTQTPIRANNPSSLRAKAENGQRRLNYAKQLRVK